MVSDSAAAQSAPVTVEIRDGVAWIALADPGRRNSLHPGLVEGLVAACELVRDDESVHVAVLNATGPVFSAGGDIDALLDPPADRRAVYRGFAALAALPVPVLGAVHAPVIGAGIGFVLACDTVLAAASATFDIRFLDVGIHPGGGHLWRLRHRVGRQATAALVLLGDIASAGDAERCGLVWRAVPDDDLDRAVAALAARAAGRDRELLVRTKATLDLAGSLDVARTAEDLEQVGQDWSQRQPAYLAGVERLRERVRGRGRPSPG